VVSESMDEVVKRAIGYQQQKHWMPMPPSTVAGVSAVLS
jgi:hypothetical protein